MYMQDAVREVRKVFSSEFADCIVNAIQKDSYQRGYSEGVNNIQKEFKPELKAEYEKGLKDAWECARKIVVPVEFGGMSGDEFNEIFGMHYYSDILIHYNVFDAMRKIKEYEEKKAAEIKVGDEIYIAECGSSGKRRAVVVGISVDGRYNIVYDSGEIACVNKSFISKTGRNLSLVAVLMEMMQDGE